MITEQAKNRCKILVFWKKHGTSATEEAFNTKRRTLFLWQSKLKEGKGKLESLNLKKTGVGTDPAPLEVILQSKKVLQNNLPEECKNGWTYTFC